MRQKFSELNHTVLDLCFHPKMRLFVLDGVLSALSQLATPLCFFVFTSSLVIGEVNLRLRLLGLSALFAPSTTENGRLEVTYAFTMM